jgi:hypothetical protein
MDDVVAGIVASLASVRAAVAALDLNRLSTTDVLDLIRAVEIDRRQADSLDQDLIAHVHHRGIAVELGVANTTTLLVGVHRISPADAGRRFRAALAMGPRRCFTGETLLPEYPHVAAAQAAGVISAEHAQVITRGISGLPDPVRDEHGAAAEYTLTGHAATMHPAQLATVTRHLVAVLNPDGIQPDEDEKQRRRDVTLATNLDGTGTLSGRLTGECLAMVQAAVDAVSAPCHTDHERDPRNPGQRRHDGLQDLCRRLLADGGLPDTGGAPTTVLLTMTLAELEARTGYATTAHGGTITVPDALRLAADADIIPVVLGDSGGILSYGRKKRLATPAQRRALTARDKGCSFPDCDWPPSWCETHHEPAWEHGGQTNLDSMTLLCPFHHRTYERSGWHCHLTDGIPWWTPPPWIDTTQTPIRNQAHGIIREQDGPGAQLLQTAPTMNRTFSARTGQLAQHQ